MCFQWAEEWQQCTGRCDYWHITQSRADGKERAVLLQLLWLSWMEHFYFFLQSQGENFDNRQELKKYIYMTLKNDCCVILLYFQPNRLHWLRALCEIYGSLFSWLKWTVASCIPADGWLLSIWGISKNDNNPSLKKQKTNGEVRHCRASWPSVCGQVEECGWRVWGLDVLAVRCKQA